MRSRNSFASILTPCLLAVCFLFIAPVDNAEAARKRVLKSGESSRNYVLEREHRARGPRIHLPVGPSYIYQDYPYYFSRGHYPRHIVEYVYYPSYFSGRRHGYGGRCSNWYGDCDPVSPRRPRARGY